MMRDGKFGSVRLAGGRFEIVPSELVLLNGEHEGSRAHLYGVWAFDCTRPCDMAGAAEGRCVGRMMGYLSDSPDLDPRLPENAEDASAMVDAALQELVREGALGGGDYSLAWAKFDMTRPSSVCRMYIGASFTKGV